MNNRQKGTSLWGITTFCLYRSGPQFNIKMSYQYRKSHCGDKTIVRSSYLHNGISYTGKMTSLYWIGALMWCELLSTFCRCMDCWRFDFSTFQFVNILPSYPWMIYVSAGGQWSSIHSTKVSFMTLGPLLIMVNIASLDMDVHLTVSFCFIYDKLHACQLLLLLTLWTYRQTFTNNVFVLLQSHKQHGFWNPCDVF